jgi:leucyl aminopeptidase
MSHEPRAADLLLAPDAPGATPSGAVLPVFLASESDGTSVPGIGAGERAWLAANAFKGAARKLLLLPGETSGISGAVLGIGSGQTGDPAGPGALLAGLCAAQLPGGVYELRNVAPTDAELAAIAWGLGAYRFRRYKTGSDMPEPARLKLAAGIDHHRVVAIVEAIWMARDLINTPASDMGPAELETAARELAARHEAKVTSIVGDALLEENFPLIHAVGRASPRAPRLIDLRWQKPGGRPDAPRVTLVGKGICFDTGGLDIKPSSGMLLMKKDMGGAATVLALGAMVMALDLDVRLRVLIPAAENSISGNAFRPQDVIRSRDGRTVEIGNTDAEGRLVLCDALSLADEEKPDVLLTFSTLTGAARVALGPDLPPYFTDDDAFAAGIAAAGLAVGDPLWRLPFWAGYEKNLDSEVADMGNVSESPFAGSIIAALYLRRFVKQARRFAHFDIYGWRQAQRPLGPKGGEPQGARAMLCVLEQIQRATGA